ncbi:MAG: MucR-family transcriptional regulator [Sphingobium sp.]|nr:MucR-family transcriptional regulator [Sphingobium sp.]
MPDMDSPDLTTLTVQLLSAYVGNNSVAPEALPDLIAATRSALSGVAAAPEPLVPEFVAAVSARKSLASRDHIVSMIDGKPYKTLKRHLGTHGLTPAEYRSRYGLPKDYPMVAPAYSEQRRQTAARIGLGRKGRGSAVSETPVVPPSTAEQQSETPAAAEAVADTAINDAPSTGTAKRRRSKLSIATTSEKPKKASAPKPAAAKRAKPVKQSDAGTPEAAAPGSSDGAAAVDTQATDIAPSTAAAKRTRAAKAESPATGDVQAPAANSIAITPRKAGRPRKVKASESVG